MIERDAKSIRSCLVPYREWDFKPRGFATPFEELTKRILSGQKLGPPTLPYKLIEESDLQNGISIVPAPGEFELLDSLNLMERGDYSGAVRRITTALEVIVESVVGTAVQAAEGSRSAVKFLKDTETNFRRRVERYEQLSARTLSDVSEGKCSPRANFGTELCIRVIVLALMSGGERRRLSTQQGGLSIGLRIISNGPT